MSIRYSLNRVNNSYYQSLCLSGNTNINNSGLIFVPYIMVQKIDNKLLIEIKKKIEKKN